MAKTINERVSSGEYAEKLPTENELMELFDVSRVTIRKSIDIVKQKYPIHRSKKGGTRILSVQPDRSNKQAVLIMPNNGYESIEIIKGAEEVFSRSSISMTIKFSDCSEKSERAIIQDLKNLDTPGSSFTQRTNLPTKTFLSIMEKGIPLVFIDRSPTNLICSSVSINNQKTAIDIVDFLVSLGHQKIVFFANELQIQQSTLERLWGYLFAMRKHRLAISKNSIYAIKSPLEVQQCFDRFFGNPENATAVFCSDDTVAVRFINEAVRRGYKIPDDFSVVGIDNRKIPEYKNVPLTTVDQYPAQVDSPLHTPITTESRKDQKRFSTHSFYSLADLDGQLAAHLN